MLDLVDIEQHCLMTEAYQAPPLTGEQEHSLYLDVSPVKNFLSYKDTTYMYMYISFILEAITNIHTCT